MSEQRRSPDAATHLGDVRDSIIDALANVSSDSAAVVTRNEDELAVVFLDSSEAYIVTIQPAGLVVLSGD